MSAYLMGKKKTHILAYAKPLELIKLAHENGEQYFPYNVHLTLVFDS